MPAWNNGFPVSYPQMYVPQPVMPYQQPPAQMLQQQPATPITNPGQAQMMTPPTIRAEIVQVEDEAAANIFPVGPGASQMMISRDESAIFIKSAMANGQTTLDVYDKRPPAPPKPVFDPSEYVRKDELDERLNGFLEAHTARTAQAQTVTAKRAVRREEDA